MQIREINLKDFEKYMQFAKLEAGLVYKLQQHLKLQELALSNLRDVKQAAQRLRDFKNTPWWKTVDKETKDLINKYGKRW